MKCARVILVLSGAVLTVCACCCCLSGYAALAQETAPVPQTPTAGSTAPSTEVPAPGTNTTEAAQTESIEELLAKWKVQELLLVQKEAEYSATESDTQKEVLRGDYLDLLNKATSIIDQIRKAAIENLKSNGADVALQKTLIGVMMNDAENNRDDLVFLSGEALVAAGVDSKMLDVAAQAERLSIAAKESFEELLIRQREALANDLPQVKITTTKGDIIVELFENEAPNTVANFIDLASKKFYDNVNFHRVLEGFMAQTGDPKGDGTGGPGYNIACECTTPEARRHFTGSLSMAKQAARDTGGSQFFLVFERSQSIQQLDGMHTVFGRITSGMDVLANLTKTHEVIGQAEQPIVGAQIDKIISVEVLRKRDHAYVPVKIGEVKSEATTPPPSQPEAKTFEKTDGDKADKKPAESDKD